MGEQCQEAQMLTRALTTELSTLEQVLIQLAGLQSEPELMSEETMTLLSLLVTVLPPLVEDQLV